MEQLQNFSPNFNPDQPTYELKPKKKKKKLKIFLIALLVIIVLPSIVFFVPIIGYYPLHFIGKAMTKPFDDSDLRLAPLKINPEDNGFYLKEEAEKYLIWKSNRHTSELLEKIFEEEIWNEDEIQSILTKNEKAIEIFNQIANKKYFQGPDFYRLSKDDFESLSNFIPLRELTRLASLKSLILARQGSYEAAWNQALTMLSIGDKIADSRGLIMHNLGGIVIKETAMKTMQKMIIDDIYYDEKIDYKNIIQKIKEHNKSFEGAINSFKMDFENFVPSVKKEFGPPNKYSLRQLENYYYFNPTNSRKLLADFMYRPLINMLQEEKCEVYQKFERNRKKDLSQFKVGPIEQDFQRIIFNSLGKRFVDIFATNSSSIIRRFCIDTASNSLIQTFIALANFKNQNGGFPNSLNELVPEFIDKIPKDTFSGKDLRYLPEKGIIYSVGADNVDNGGNPKSDIIIDIQNPTFDFY